MKGTQGKQPFSKRDSKAHIPPGSGRGVVPVAVGGRVVARDGYARAVR